MRIGFDAKRAFLNRSGLGNYSRDIIRSLHQLFPGNEYFLYTPEKGETFQPDEGNPLNLRRPPEGWGKLRKAWWRSVGLVKELERDQLDLYHGLSNELPSKIHLSRIKTVVTIHDLIFMRYPEWYKRIDRSIYRKKFFYAAKTADRIISVSQQTKNDLMEYFDIPGEKISVIYQGCNPAFAVRLNEEEKKRVRSKWELPDEYILYVGTVEERKNLISLLKALHQKALSIPLVVVGRPTKYMKEVNAYIRSKNLKNIIFLKEVAVPDLPGIFQMARVFVYPSLFEGCGIPVLEALVSGVPVITSKGGCFAEVGGPSSLYVDPGNDEELGAQLSLLLEDEGLQKKMIQTGLLHAQQFTNETIARQIMEVYKELAHAGGS